MTQKILYYPVDAERPVVIDYDPDYPPTSPGIYVGMQNEELLPMFTITRREFFGVS